MPRVCLFCGKANDLTEEHIIGKWVRELFLNAGFPSGGHLAKRGTVAENAEKFETEFQAGLFTRTMGGVCGSCNNGWMSAMEVAVKPFLGPMMLKGERKRLTRHDQRALAAWAVKTLLVDQCTHPRDKRLIPESTYKEFYKAKNPGNNHLVWLGFRGEIDKDDSGNQLIAASQIGPIRRFGVLANMPAQRREQLQSGLFYVGTIAIGRVILQVVGHDHPLTFDFKRTPRDWLVKIWKVENHVVWPPPLAVGSFDGLHESINGPNNQPTQGSIVHPNDG